MRINLPVFCALFLLPFGSRAQWAKTSNSPIEGYFKTDSSNLYSNKFCCLPTHFAEILTLDSIVSAIDSGRAKVWTYDDSTFFVIVISGNIGFLYQGFRQVFVKNNQRILKGQRIGILNKDESSQFYELKFQTVTNKKQLWPYQMIEILHAKRVGKLPDWVPDYKPTH